MVETLASLEHARRSGVELPIRRTGVYTKPARDRRELTADDALAFASATTLAAVIRVRRLSPAKATCGALDRINLAQPVLNSFITGAEDAVMTQAREAEAAMSGARRWVRRLACRSR
jgi:hypothetical protein